MSKGGSYIDNLEQFLGCMIGGAVGDALGYPIEFLSLDEIMRQYGAKGITKYSLINGKARISDDTQMLLFTANGLLYGTTRGCLRGIMGEYESYIYLAYLDWLSTQEPKMNHSKIISWIYSIPELHVRRDPGTTCLNALKSGTMGTMEHPLNDSKGCGGIMRAAPVALFCHQHFINPEDETIDFLGAKTAAITHGHPLGFIPAAALVHIISRLIFDHTSVSEAVTDSIQLIRRLFKKYPQVNPLESLLKQAANLAESEKTDTEAIRLLGSGWVAEETLAIAVFCSLRYSNDFAKGVIAAVNHSGDSDSTGAVTGNILGAALGYLSIPEYFLENLELKDTIEEITKDLYTGCTMSEYSTYKDPPWLKKYVYVLS